MDRMDAKRLVLTVVAAVAMMGCRVTPHGAVVADVSPKGWEPSEAVELCYDNTDTLSARTVSIVARREFGKAEGPLELHVRVCAPDSAMVEAYVVLPQRGDKGGSFEELRALWVEGASLQVGTYTFTIAPQKSTTGVWNVGIEIEN